MLLERGPDATGQCRRLRGRPAISACRWSHRQGDQWILRPGVQVPVGAARGGGGGGGSGERHRGECRWKMTLYCIYVCVCDGVGRGCRTWEQFT